jgi:AcrR family transcriptional regulator
VAPGVTSAAAAIPDDRTRTEDRFLDAAERLLVEVGFAGITTRKLAEEAGANHGLVHYYFGSMERLYLRVLERFTARLIARQRNLYSSDIPFAEKWRQAMHYLVTDREYQKVWLELQALAWNRPDLRSRVALINREWRGVLREAIAPVRDRLGLDMPLDALVTLVMTFNEGVILDRASGITAGHRELSDWTEKWLRQQERGAKRSGR